MKKNQTIFVAGHKGMVGSAIVRKLQEEGYENIIGRTHEELDLRNQKATTDFFFKEVPDYVFLAAARVGGILENDTYRAEFIYNNLMIQANVIHAAYESGVKKLLFLGSSVIYSAPLEPSNEPYAIAKIAGIKLCEAYRDQYGCNFISAIPCNLFGEGDNYSQSSTHVIPSLLRRFHEAKINNLPEVTVWGSGNQRREFLYSDDVAHACVFLMGNYDDRLVINVGTGYDVSINVVANIVKNEVGYKGKIVFDTTKPYETMRKVMDISRLQSMGWIHKTSLHEGIKLAYHFFKQQLK